MPLSPSGRLRFEGSFEQSAHPFDGPAATDRDFHVRHVGNGRGHSDRHVAPARRIGNHQDFGLLVLQTPL
jgi:hypothetical protein